MPLAGHVRRPRPGGPENTGGNDLRRFAARFPALLAAIDGALAEASHLRRMITT